MQGKEIEQTVLKAVKSLMEDMEKKGVSDAEFKNLCSTVHHPKSPQTQLGFLTHAYLQVSGNTSVGLDAIQQFTVSRAFTARQVLFEYLPSLQHHTTSSLLSVCAGGRPTQTHRDIVSI
jgi:hypothetical protein